MTRSTLPPSSPLSLWSLSLFCVIGFACATSLNKVEHCELECASSTVEGLNVVGNCEPKCSEELTIPINIEKEKQDVIKEYLDNLFSKALFGGGSTETDQDERNREYEVEQNLTIPSHIEEQGEDATKEYLDNLFSKTLFGTDSTQTEQNKEAHPNSYSVKHEGERNMDAEKSSYKLPKKPEEEQLLDGDTEVNIDMEIVGDGEYVLKIKRVNPISTDENLVERAKHMAQNGAMLLHYGEILQNMGEKLLTQSQESLYSVFEMPAPPKLKSDDQ